MREIICAQLGQCGNAVGHKFWENLCEEHGIEASTGRRAEGEEEIGRNDVYFEEARDGRYVPRAVLVDLESAPLDKIRASASGTLFRPDNMVHGSEGASNNWAKGHYTDGAELFDVVVDVVRREAERCDCLQGFQLVHSIGGGTGSGLGSLLTHRFRDEFPDRMLSTYSVMPSEQVSNVVVEPYNAVLTLHHLVEETNMVNVLHNTALYNICTDTLRIPLPTHHDLNHLIALSMSGATCSLRFGGELNADLRKLAVNMVPFPRLHFLTPSLAPLVARRSATFEPRGVAHLVEQLFSQRHSLVECNLAHGKYLTAAVMFRGDVSMSEIEHRVLDYTQRREEQFADWLPNNVKMGHCSVAPPRHRVAASFVGNTTAVHETITRLCTNFSIMFRRKAFVHWYVGEGMETMEFIEAESNVIDLASEYRQFASAHTESSPSSVAGTDELNEAINAAIVNKMGAGSTLTTAQQILEQLPNADHTTKFMNELKTIGQTEEEDIEGEEERNNGGDDHRDLPVDPDVVPQS